MGIQRVAVVGGGQMGGGVAELTAKAGLPTVIKEVSAEAAEHSETGIRRSLDRALERGKLDEAAHAAALANLTFTTDYGDLADADLVVEAVVESFDLKAEIFAVLDEAVTSPDAVLATNTSSIPIIDIAMATGRPEQVIGLHFFNPAPVMKLVEVIPSVRTNEAVTASITVFATDVLGKVVVAMGLAGVGAQQRWLPMFLGGAMLAGAGSGYIRPTVANSVTAAAGDADLGIAGGSMNMLQQIGAAVGITVLTALMADSLSGTRFLLLHLAAAGAGLVAAWLALGIEDTPAGSDPD